MVISLKPKSKLKTQLNRQIRQIKFPPSLAKICKRVWTLAGAEHFHEMRHFGFFSNENKPQTAGENAVK